MTARKFQLCDQLNRAHIANSKLREGAARLGRVIQHAGDECERLSVECDRLRAALAEAWKERDSFAGRIDRADALNLELLGALKKADRLADMGLRHNAGEFDALIKLGEAG